MRVLSRRRIALLSALLALPTAAPAQTRAILDAPVVTSVIRVEYDKPGKKVKYAIDQDLVTHDIPSDLLLLAKSRTAVIVTYRRLNPLKLQASAAVTDVDDPAHANIVKLLEAIMAVAKVVKPETTKAGDDKRIAMVQESQAGCSNLTKALPDAMELDGKLYGPTTTPESVRGHFKTWIKAIDDGFGKGEGKLAVEDGARAMSGLINATDAAMNAAKDVIERIEKAVKTPPGDDPCDQLVHYFYDILNLTNPRERLDQLASLKAAVTTLQKTLRDEYGDGHWVDGTVDFRVSGDIAPTGKTAKQVAVKINAIDFDVDDVTSALEVGRREAASAQFTVRKYSSFAVEVGTGAVMGFVHRVKYGTGKNDAQETVVAATDDKISVDPSLIVNFVCQCMPGPFIAPMFQVGVSTSKDAPAILLGGGLRLFSVGKGDVALGVGVVLGFVKELNKLQVGKPTKGTSEIDGDLNWQPVFRSLDADGKRHLNWYSAIQYKF